MKVIVRRFMVSQASPVLPKRLSKHHKSTRQVQIEFRIDFEIHLCFVCVILEKVLIETILSKFMRDKEQSSMLSSSFLLIVVCPCQATVNCRF